MPQNKDKTDPQTAADQSLEGKVDAMMDVRSTAPPVSEPLDIFADSDSVETIKAKPEQLPEPASDDIVVDPIELDTPQSDAAIDDIVAQEADEVLAAQDAGIDVAHSEVEAIADKPEKTGHPIFWFIILVLAVLAMITAYVLLTPGLALPFSA